MVKEKKSAKAILEALKIEMEQPHMNQPFVDRTKTAYVAGAASYLAGIQQGLISHSTTLE
jgi:hypothetical protein